jgi:hypothetical protein
MCHPLSSPEITEQLRALRPELFVRPADGEDRSFARELGDFKAFLGELKRCYDVKGDIAAGWRESPFDKDDMIMAYIGTGNWEEMCVFSCRMLDDV